MLARAALRNLRPLCRVLFRMEIRESIAIVGNFLLIGGLVFGGFALFAQYHATGRWAKNFTNLLAGMGMLTLAFALTIKPQNIAVLARISTTKAPSVFYGVSSFLLLAAIAASNTQRSAVPEQQHGQQQKAAYAVKDAGSLGSRDARQHRNILWLDRQREGQRQHAHAGQQIGEVLRPSAGRVILRKQGKAAKDEPANQQEIANDCDGFTDLHTK